jgi:para-nitrobenzyl esterase
MRAHEVLHIGLAASIVCSFAPARAQDVVRIRSGRVAGQRAGDVAVYKGIPYAAPPTGERRRKPPQPAAAWSGVLDAASHGLPCPQRPFLGTPFVKEWSEDCLKLDVWTPALASARPFPVIVSIPGGGFYAGGSADPSTDGSALARQGVVVVTFNYRLGVFGFLAHPMLSKESPAGVSGNYGLMDQIAALRWVQENIAAFGGDPRNVTITGSSAGGSSVLYLMASPLARGLFARGVAQSPALVHAPLAALRERRYGLEPREAAGYSLGADISALRALPAQELLARVGPPFNMFEERRGNDYWPFVDGAVLPDEPWALFASGRFARVPLIIGTTTDEGTVFAAFDRRTMTADAWHEHLARRHPGVEREVQSAYAASPDTAVHSSAVRWVNDWFFHGTARAVARAVSSRGVPVFLYNFSRTLPAPSVRGRSLGAAHSSEVRYVFSTLNAAGALTADFVDQDHALSRAMSSAWVQFARTGDPNRAELPTWPRYETSTDRHLDFGAEIRAGSGLHARSLDVFDSTFARMRALSRGDR